MLNPPNCVREANRAQVERLTFKERECLDRWLAHATAKEIALDLGITHHAVEKRLKSARAKLGVATTLDAARLLAAAEGYGPTASQSPELAAAAAAAENNVVKAPPTGRRRGLTIIIAGAIIMSLVILAALALAGQSQPAPAPSTRKVVVVDRTDGRSADLATALGTVFARLDKNGDKVIAGDELATSQFRIMRTMISQGGTSSAPVATTLTQFDSDRDGRVSEAEFRVGMTALTERPR